MNPAADEGARRNSFDVLRLLAAAAVAFGHQLEFAGRPEPALGPLGVSLSNTGLFVFFALSGCLIWRSLERDPRPGRFAAARLRRIYPGAAANALACVVFGAAVTTVGQGAYWTDRHTWSYLLHGIAIVVPPTVFTLPGVFADARWPEVDTPIWTLKYELLCYVGAFALHRLAAPRLGARPALALTTALLAGGGAWHVAAGALPDAADFYARYNGFNLLRFGAIFAYGALLSAAEGEGGAPWRLAARLAPAALVALVPDPALNRVGQILLVALLAVEVGRTPLLWSAAYRRFGDLSYGVYLYAYPVGSFATARLFTGENFAIVAAMSGAITMGLAVASWWKVERRFLLVRPSGRRCRVEKRSLYDRHLEER